MTEAQWLTCPNPTLMLVFVRGSGRASPRKLRLFACAWGRCIWQSLTDPRSRAAVEAGERYADGLASLPELAAAHEAAWRAVEDEVAEVRFEEAAYARDAKDAARPVGDAYGTGRQGTRLNAGEGGRRQAALLRDLFGNPFRPAPAIDPGWLAWNGGTVPRLAQAIYGDRAFDRLPVLADALQDAGCEHPDILAHCRGDGPHVRGCWVVDLLLGNG